MMHDYFLGQFIKQRQQEILDEVRRNQMSNAINIPKASFCKTLIRELREILVVMRTRMHNLCRYLWQPEDGQRF